MKKYLEFHFALNVHICIFNASPEKGKQLLIHSGMIFYRMFDTTNIFCPINGEHWEQRLPNSPEAEYRTSAFVFLFLLSSKLSMLPIFNTNEMVIYLFGKLIA